MNPLTSIALFGFVACTLFFILALGGKADATLRGNYATGPTLKRFLERSQKAFGIAAAASGSSPDSPPSSGSSPMPALQSTQRAR